MERKFNCYVYALGLSSEEDFTYDGKIPPAISLSGLSMERLVRSLVRKDSPTKGDLVIYRNDKDCITHAGIFLEGENILSKWGTEEGPKEHLIEDASQYGNRISFYEMRDRDYFLTFFSS